MKVRVDINDCEATASQTVRTVYFAFLLTVTTCFHIFCQEQTGPPSPLALVQFWCQIMWFLNGQLVFVVKISVCNTVNTGIALV